MRSIPAHAGEPSRPRLLGRYRRVDPRARGGAPPPSCNKSTARGRSPRTRGSRAAAIAASPLQGSIPAHAGEPHTTPTPWLYQQVNPRARGGAARVFFWPLSYWGRSPRTRGSPPTSFQSRPSPGSIPAHAGEPYAQYPCIRPSRVDPRARGGALLPGTLLPTHTGRSPRTRGSRRRVGNTLAQRRSIPAHAGEPCTRKAGTRGARVDPRARGGAWAKSGGNPMYPGSIPAHAGEPRWR